MSVLGSCVQSTPKSHSREISKTFVTRSHIFAFELSRLPLFMADHCYSSCQKTLVNQKNLNTTSYNCHSGCRKTLFDQNNQNDRQNSNAIKRDLVRKSLLISKNWTLGSCGTALMRHLDLITWQNTWSVTNGYTLQGWTDIKFEIVIYSRGYNSAYPYLISPI